MKNLFLRFYTISVSLLTLLFLSSSTQATNAKVVNILSPEEQQKLFVLAPGFEIELVASEKMGMRKIVDISFDTQGRMWACTASEYPADSFSDKTRFKDMLDKKGVNPNQRVKKLWEEGGIDEVLIFPNPTAKTPSKPILFGAGRALPMGVLPYKNGVIVIEGPRLLYLEDTDGDNQADKKTILAEGFGAQDTHTGAHGLKYMPGDWITIANGVLCWGDIKDRSGKVTPYERSGIAYIRPDGHDFHISTKGFQNIWGFYLGKNGQAWMHEANNVGYPLAPYHEYTSYPMTTSKKYLLRDYMLPFPPTVGPGDKPVDLEGSGLSGIEKSDDLVNGFPPEWQKRFLIAHPVPRKIQSMTATQRSDQSFQILRGPDLLSSKDPNFRPVDVEFGPDGCLYIVDWYNPIISHNEVARDDPRRNKQATRIWRVRHKSQTAHPKPNNVKNAPVQKLLSYLRSPNSWEQESAWKEIAERQDRSIIKDLEKIAADKSEIERNRIHAIWSLESLRHYNPKLWQILLSDKNQYIRTEAVRALRQVQPDLNVTFPLIYALAKKEKVFTVTKAILHYLAKAKGVESKHITWMMQWKSKEARKYSHTSIKHKVTKWKNYIPNHYEDLLRIALESHPVAVISYIQDKKNNKDNQKFLSKLIVPRLDKKYALLAAGNFKAKDLKDPKTRILAMTNLSNPKFFNLSKTYLAGFAPEAAISEVINLSIPLSSELKKLLNPIVIKLLQSGEQSAQEAYLKASIYIGELSGLKTEEAIKDYLEKISSKHQDLLPLAINTMVKTKVKSHSLYSSFVTNAQASDLSKTYAFLGRLIYSNKEQWELTLADLKKFHENSGTLEKEQLYTILAEYPRSLVGLFTALENVTDDKFNQHYDTYKFLIARHDSIMTENLAAFAAKGYEHLRKGLQNSEKIKDSEKLFSRWKSVAKGTPVGKPEIGKSLFQALCLSCHTYQSKGQGIAPALDGSGNRSLDGLITAIVKPDEGVESVYLKTHIQLHNGQHLNGLLKSEENSLYIYQMGGGKIKVMPEDISYRFTSQRSFMPDFLTKGLGDQQLADLLIYIRSL